MIIFVFFTVLSFYYFFFYLNKTAKTKFIIISGLFLSLSFGFRFEALLCIPLLTLLLIIKKKVRDSLIFFIFVMIIPTIYMVESYRQTGHLLEAALTSAKHSLLVVEDIGYGERILPLFSSLNNLLTPLLWPSALAGILFSFYSRKNYYLGIIILAYLAVFGYKSACGTFGPYLVRYFLLIIILMLPYSLYFLQFLLENHRIFSQRTKKILTWSFLLIFSTIFIFKTFADTEKSKMSSGTKELVLWIRNKVGINDKLILERIEHPYIFLESHLHYHQIFTPNLSLTKELDKDSFWNIVKETSPCYLACSSNTWQIGIYKSILLSPEEKEKAIFTEVFSNNLWKVYKIINLKE
jgi:hypothetical protein